jgi:cytochrome c
MEASKRFCARAGALLAFSGLLSLASAKFTSPDCPDVTENDFRFVKVVTKTAGSDPSLQELVKMDFDMQPNGKVDVYFIERSGKLKRYDAAANQVTVAAQLDVSNAHEQGLVGIAMDPRFHQTHWVYLFYCPKTQTVFRISRFVLSGGKLDMQSEKILLSIPIGSTVSKHTGGGMAFDASGDLWITLGNNSPDQPHVVDESDWESSAEASSGNAADLRGSVLRIHPDDSPKGYTIPKGNYGEYFSAQFAAQGKADVAKQYADTAMVKPEIFVKGTRSPYSLTVDPYRRWVTWGEFGPFPGTEEHNLAQHPYFGGYPYFAGSQVPVLKDSYLATAGKKDPDAPVNNSKWNKGPKLLPPATPALHVNAKHGGTTGPIYRYDGDLQSPVKFPPHFDKAWFVTDYANTGLSILQLNDAGDKILNEETWFTAYNFLEPLDLKQGPDGALYVATYGGSHGGTNATLIGRIEYTGSCHPALPKLPTTAVEPQPAWGNSGVSHASMHAGRLRIEAQGDYDVSLHDLGGRELFRAQGRGTAEFPLPPMAAGSGAIWIMQVKTPAGSWSGKLTDL